MRHSGALPPLVTSWEVERLKAAAQPPSGDVLSSRAVRVTELPPAGPNHDQQVEDPAPDESGADLRAQTADHQGRSVRRPVREAPFQPAGNPRGNQPALLSWRSDQSPGLHRSGSDAQPEAHAQRIPPRSAHHQLHPFFGRGRLRGSPSPRILGPGLRPPFAESQGVSPDGGVHQDSLQFMETLAGTRAGSIRRVDFFTSHEGLHLPYEQAQTRQVPHREGWTTSIPTCRGSACAPPMWAGPTWSTSEESGIPSGSRSGRE